MPAFIILAFLLSSTIAQAHTTGQEHIHLQCLNASHEHCPASATGADQSISGGQSLPTMPDKAKTSSDKEH
jgi:hypothetical protein